MQCRVVLVISEITLNVTSVEKLFLEKKVVILLMRLSIKKSAACDLEVVIVISNVRMIKQSVNCDDSKVLN